MKTFLLFSFFYGKNRYFFLRLFKNLKIFSLLSPFFTLDCKLFQLYYYAKFTLLTQKKGILLPLSDFYETIDINPKFLSIHRWFHFFMF